MMFMYFIREDTGRVRVMTGGDTMVEVRGILTEGS